MRYGKKLNRKSFFFAFGGVLRTWSKCHNWWKSSVGDVLLFFSAIRAWNNDAQEADAKLNKSQRRSTQLGPTPVAIQTNECRINVRSRLTFLHDKDWLASLWSEICRVPEELSFFHRTFPFHPSPNNYITFSGERVKSFHLLTTQTDPISNYRKSCYAKHYLHQNPRHFSPRTFFLISAPLGRHEALRHPLCWRGHRVLPPTLLQHHIAWHLQFGRFDEVSWTAQQVDLDSYRQGWRINLISVSTGAGDHVPSTRLRHPIAGGTETIGEDKKMKS